MDFTEKAAAYIQSNNMLAEGDAVCAGVSGGADSVCLLLVLKDLEGRFGLKISAFHVNHGLRGAESDRDEAFTRNLCGRLGVPLYVFHEDVRALAEKEHISEEEAGQFIVRKRYSPVSNEDELETVLSAICPIGHGSYRWDGGRTFDDEYEVQVYFLNRNDESYVLDGDCSFFGFIRNEVPDSVRKDMELVGR